MKKFTTPIQVVTHTKEAADKKVQMFGPELSKMIESTGANPIYGNIIALATLENGTPDGAPAVSFLIKSQIMMSPTHAKPFYIIAYSTAEDFAKAFGEANVDITKFATRHFAESMGVPTDLADVLSIMTDGNVGKPDGQ